MKTIGAFEAKTHLSELLQKVAHGETFVITKRGKPLASLSPIAPTQGSKFVDDILAYRRRHAKALKKAKITVEEIIEWKNEGRR